MAPVTYNPTRWTGDVEGSAPYRVGKRVVRIGRLAAATPVSEWPPGIWRDIQDKPMAWSGPFYLAGGALLSFAGHAESNYYMMLPALVETGLNVALMLHGDGGDQSERTDMQLQKSETFERRTWMITTVLGAVYTAGGLLNHGGEIYGGEVALGLFTTFGAVVGWASKKPKNPTDFRDVGRALKKICATTGKMTAAALRRDIEPLEIRAARREELRTQFGETLDTIGNLSPYKKMGGIWFGATLSLLPEFLKTQDPVFVPCLMAFAAANALICMSEKAEPEPPSSSPRPDQPQP